MVKSLGDTVGCSITVHHLLLIVDDWTGCCHNFCKPVAKFPHDREALRQVIRDGHPRFFMGTDSAPHPKTSKEGSVAAAGVFVTSFLLQYLVHILDSFGALDRINAFACENGRKFYGIEAPLTQSVVTLVKSQFVVPQEIAYINDEGKAASLVPFLAGKSLNWNLQ
jgi:dihydroorotase